MEKLNGVLPYKGYGRIFVKNKEDMAILKSIIKEIDEREYAYLPDDLIGLISDYPYIKYIAKFDIDVDELAAVCFSRGLNILIIGSVVDIDYPHNYIENIQEN